MVQKGMRVCSAYDLIDSFDAFLLDAYGVLVQSSGLLPGAAEFVAELRRRGKKIRIVTNDASKTPETWVAHYGSKGLSISLEELMSAGLTLAPAFERKGLKDPACAVLGTADTIELVRRAGGRPDAISAKASFDAVVIGDDSGFDFLPTMNALLSSLHRSIKEGKSPALLLTNSDLIYPSAVDAYGFTSGSLARLLEIGLEQLHPTRALRFEVLGKPESLIFETALKSAGVPASRAVMFGDQLKNDVTGAKRAGLATALLTTGITQWPLPERADPTPDFVIHSLRR